MRQEQLEKAINKKRDEMIKIGLAKGLQCEETILCSQELDDMINEYNRLKLRPNRFNPLQQYHELILFLNECTFKLLMLGCSSYIRYFQV
ncbi:aspartyl-phosphate phosphatase Spo0E family protein [Paenibacillus sp. BSR1-1]|uniref:aspartyl-phosphate phosphatase Spo0E family protein n=1 Tax=Paenibacillus sp. BSR1-1 TaxID=3020845 RepID=UPI0025AF9744|nr:aspartyl-phosphate phosphatase Spo0E family protein [Paenibacillus sp. BSR1-1]MDN3016048.1 aspartyl-phosphate phosphatase Spo0E family protein [Paenibacillus sp. BSR1-1]